MLLEFIVNSNIPWRLIGKRRTPTSKILKHMNYLYKELENHSYTEAILYGDLIIYENSIKNYEDLYWNMNTFVNKLSKYYVKNNIVKSI